MKEKIHGMDVHTVWVETIYKIGFHTEAEAKKFAENKTSICNIEKVRVFSGHRDPYRFDRLSKAKELLDSMSEEESKAVLEFAKMKMKQS